MKLIITDWGDPSVGVFENTMEIDCPFERERDDFFGEYQLTEPQEFKEQMLNIYKEYANGKLTAAYDFELKYKDEEHCWD